MKNTLRQAPGGPARRRPELDPMERREKILAQLRGHAGTAVLTSLAAQPGAATRHLVTATGMHLTTVTKTLHDARWCLLVRRDHNLTGRDRWTYTLTPAGELFVHHLPGRNPQ